MARGPLPTSSVDASPTKRTLWLAGTTADWTPQPPVKQGVERPDVPEFWLLERDLHEQAERIDRLAADWNS
jgi:hypothetical protein